MTGPRANGGRRYGSGGSDFFSGRGAIGLAAAFRLLLAKHTTANAKESVGALGDTPTGVIEANSHRNDAGPQSFRSCR